MLRNHAQPHTQSYAIIEIQKSSKMQIEKKFREYLMGLKNCGKKLFVLNTIFNVIILEHAFRMRSTLIDISRKIS